MGRIKASQADTSRLNLNEIEERVQGAIEQQKAKIAPSSVERQAPMTQSRSRLMIGGLLVIAIAASSGDSDDDTGSDATPTVTPTVYVIGDQES